MSVIIIKAIGVWILMVMVAIINGLLREKILLPLLGNNLALPLSGILLSTFVFVITFLTIPFFSKTEVAIYIGIGLFWVTLTLIFELLGGRYISGKSWREIAQVFNIKRGDLFLLVLLTSAVSPWLAAKLRGII